MNTKYLLALLLVSACGGVKTERILSVNKTNSCSSVSCALQYRAKPIATSAAVPIPTPPIVAKCPDNMAFISGEYCTDVNQECDVWLDPPGTYLGRCQKFKPSECIGEKVHKEFCVDIDEYTVPGETLPAVNVSWYKAKEICESENKRLCQETEWEFACEGEQMYPHTTGYERDSVDCNYDLNNLVNNQGTLNDYRKPSASLNKCVSPFGVRNMNGNVDELVYRDRSNGRFNSALKGGWWMAARERCRPATTEHFEYYSGAQVGFRCCAENK